MKGWKVDTDFIQNDEKNGGESITRTKQKFKKREFNKPNEYQEQYFIKHIEINITKLTKHAKAFPPFRGLYRDKINLQNQRKIWCYSTGHYLKE